MKGLNGRSWRREGRRKEGKQAGRKTAKDEEGRNGGRGVGDGEIWGEAVTRLCMASVSSYRTRRSSVPSLPSAPWKRETPNTPKHMSRTWDLRSRQRGWKPTSSGRGLPSILNLFSRPGGVPGPDAQAST